MLKYSFGKIKYVVYVVFHILKQHDVFTFLHSPDTSFLVKGSSAVVYGIRTADG